MRFGGPSVQFGLRWDAGFGFIYPGGMLVDPEDPSRPQQVTVHGRLRLKLAKQKTFRRILAKAAIRYVVCLPHEVPYEGERMEQECEILGDRREFDQGVHELPLAFLFPASLQAGNSVFSRHGFCQYFSVHVEAETEEGKMYDAYLPKLWKLPDRFPNWESSDTERFRLWPNPAQIGELPPPLNLRINDYLENFGPCCIQAWSNSLTIGSLIHYKIAFTDPPAAFHIHSFKVYVLERVQWKSPKAPYKTHIFPETKHLVTNKIGQIDKLSRFVAKGEPAEIEVTARMPHDEQIDATTLLGTVGPENVTHKLCFEVEVQQLYHASHQFIRINRPITIPLCTCLPETLLVPSYSFAEPEAEAYSDFQPERKKDPFPCICGFSTKQLLEREENTATDAQGAGAALDLAPKRNAQSVFPT